MSSNDSRVAELERRVYELETDKRHLTNELKLTQDEYEESTRNYFDIHSNMERLVHERTTELEELNDKLRGEISERKQAEGKLQEYKDQLEMLVEERTRDLQITNELLQQEITERQQMVSALKKSEDTLKQAKELAEEGNRLKSRFVFNVSHEIRTPLNGIIGFAEIISESTDIETIHNQSRIILQESDALLMLVNDLLDHAKIEAGKMALDNRPLDLFKLLENLVASAHPQARAKGLDFNVEMDSNVPRYGLGDFLRLRQILLNLISNAIKFSEVGEVKVSINVDVQKRKHSMLRFSVSDTGIGIPIEKQKSIFESFTQADASTTRKYGGTGLGTTIAGQLVELMGGEIELESRLGYGSTFWFTLPFFHSLPPVDGDDLDNLPDISLAADAKPVKKQGWILLAEDYLTNQEIAKLHILGAGYNLLIVENGKDAVAACNRRRFDLILMDLQMPVMDGHEATRLIRSGDSPCRSVPILAMTASAEASTRESCLLVGMNDVITKPIRQASFLASLENWCGVKGGRLATQGIEAQTLITSTEQRLPEQAKPESGREYDMERDPIDYDMAVEEFGGNRNLLNSILKQFIKVADDQFAMMREAITNNDAETLRGEAHKIKGGAANLTAVKLSEVARKLEFVARDGCLEEAEALLDELSDEYSGLRLFLSSII